MDVFGGTTITLISWRLGLMVFDTQLRNLRGSPQVLATAESQASG